MPVSVTRVDYHGWKGCYRLANSTLEVIVVPAIGRIMGLRRIGDDAGVLWENRGRTSEERKAGLRRSRIGRG